MVCEYDFKLSMWAEFNAHWQLSCCVHRKFLDLKSIAKMVHVCHPETLKDFPPPLVQELGRQIMVSEQWQMAPSVCFI